MKATEPGAPMISVPAGVLKEFMSPTNSRTPTPPSGITSVVSKSSAQTTNSESNSRTPSPVLPSSIDLSSVTVHAVKGHPRATSPLTNGLIVKEENEASLDSEASKGSSSDADKTKDKVDFSGALHNGTSTGVKRTNEEEGASKKPDLKKIRVFAPTADDTVKRDVSVAVKEFNQHLDQASKKLEEAGKENKDLKMLNELRNCFNNVPTGSGILNSLASGDGSSSTGFASSSITITPSALNNTTTTATTNDLTATTVANNNNLTTTATTTLTTISVSTTPLISKSPVNTTSTTEIEVLPSVSKLREVLTPISKERDVQLSNTKDKVLPVVDKENKVIKRRLQKLPRKELENMIMRQFSEKTLYQCELGKMKQLCEKLETTLESNRKKTAQFHKEIEDLRKVTNRLSTEHASRKGQYVAPIRIKRSVGIQAAPHIINKGIMHANGSGGMIKTIAPRPSTLAGVSSVSNPVKSYCSVGGQVRSPPNVTFHTKVIPSSNTPQGLVTHGALGILATSQAGVGRPQAMSTMGASGLTTVAAPTQTLGTIRPTTGQMLMMTPSGAMQALPRGANTGVVSTATAVLPVAQGRVVRAPIGGLTSVVSATGTLLGTQRSMLLQNDKAITGTTAALQTPLTSRGSGVIDLTDEDEGNRIGRPATMVPKPGTLMKVPASGTAQLLPIQAGGVGQVVLLPQMSGGQPATALIVSQVSSSGMQTLDSMTNPTVAQARIGSVGSHTANSSRVVGSVVSTAPRTTTSTVSQSNQLRHPAPLPKTPYQQMGGLSKKLPPQPTLKLSHKDSKESTKNSAAGRLILEAEFKSKVVALAKSTSNCAAAREFLIKERIVRCWRKSDSIVREIPEIGCAMRLGPSYWPDLETHLLDWVCRIRQNGFDVNRGAICERALKWAESYPELCRGFSALVGWCDRFMARKYLVVNWKKDVLKKIPENLKDKIKTFLQLVAEQRAEHKFPLSRIGKVETPVDFDTIGNRTVESGDSETTPAKTVRFAVVLTCLADGTKLKPMIILQQKTAPKVRSLAGVFIHHHESGWMGEDGVKLWVDNVWNERPGALRNDGNLLMWDVLKPHLSEITIKHLGDANTKIAVVPKDVASTLRPFCSRLDEPFKNNMHNEWKKWTANVDKSLAGNGYTRPLPLNVLCQFVRNSWKAVKIKTVVNSFIICGIYYNTIDSDDDDDNSDDDDDDDDDDVDYDDSDDNNDEAVLRVTPAVYNELFATDDESEEFVGF